MTEPQISARTAAIIVAAVNLQRLYRLHLTDDEVREDLGTLARVAWQWNHANADVRRIGICEPPEPPSEMTAHEAAGVLGVSEQAVRRALRTGRLQGAKRGRQWAITARAIAAYSTRRPEDHAA